MFGPIKSLAESTGRIEQIKQKQAEAQASADVNASRSFADTAAKQFEAMKTARGEMPQRKY
jgi:phage shock protein A